MLEQATEEGDLKSTLEWKLPPLSTEECRLFGRNAKPEAEVEEFLTSDLDMLFFEKNWVRENGLLYTMMGSSGPSCRRTMLE